MKGIKGSPVPKWLSESGMVVVSNWEPLIFRRRKGAAAVDEEERFEEEHSEAFVLGAKKVGANIYITHFHKGFGTEAEREEMEKTRDLIKLCHKHGMRVGVYIRPDSLVYETFLAQEPSARDWFQVTADGRHHTYAYSPSQYYRYHPCLNQEAYMAYLEDVVRSAVEAGADLIHFDDLELVQEPDSCQCQACREKFLAFLRTKYPDEKKRKERFGFTILDHIQPPHFLNFHCVSGELYRYFPVIDDPLLQEWIAFRCHYASQAYQRLAELIRSLNPETAVEYNATHSGINGINTAFSNGLWHPQSAVHGNVFWTEEGNEAGVTAEGVLLSKIRTFKVARALSNVVFSYTHHADLLTELRLRAESFAYNPGANGGIPSRDPEPGYNRGIPSPDAHPEAHRYVAFYREHWGEFRDTEIVADAAVLRSYASLAHNNYTTHRAVLLAEQTLIQAKIGFEIVFDEHLADLSASDKRIWILGNVESMSDEQAGTLIGFVKDGGKLIATEETSLRDPWRRARTEFALADLFGISSPEDTTVPIMRHFGNGRVVYIPKLVPRVDANAVDRGYLWFKGPYWHLPENWETLVLSVRWAAGDDLILDVQAPLTVTAELVRQPSTDRMMLHLVNYENSRPVPDVKVSIRVPSGKRVKSVTALSPDGDGSGDLSFKGEDHVDFVLPWLRTYTMVVVE